MTLAAELETLIKNNDLTIIHWIKLLNFFEFNKDELNINEIQQLADACEQCRQHLNKPRVVKLQVRDKIIEITRPGYGIEKQNTNPNIYQYLTKKIEENAETNIQYPIVVGR